MRQTPYLKQLAIICSAYAVSGLLALHMAIPPGYVSPLYPPAGIALAAVLIFGQRIWPAIFIGALLTNIEAVTRSGLEGWAWLTPLMVAVGSVLQAFAGRALARRWGRFPEGLDSASTTLRFLFLAGPASCLIGASFGTASLLLSGAIPLVEGPYTWWNWWAGDAIGILIATPPWAAAAGDAARQGGLSVYLADANAYIAQYGPVNSSRIETFHAADLRVDRKWTWKSWQLSAYLDVTNVYAHARVLGYSYNFDFSKREPITELPFLPALGVRGTF